MLTLSEWSAFSPIDMVHRAGVKPSLTLVVENMTKTIIDFPFFRFATAMLKFLGHVIHH
jgi:hypothetical protein